MLEPQVLLFDEPLSNLDAKLRRHVRDEIREIQQKLGLTVVYVTHDQEEALAVSDRIIVMNNAVIAQDGTPRDLYDAPANAFVADFIGEANILPCTIAAVTGDAADVVLGPARLTLPSRGLAPGPARLAVRPARLALAPAGSAGTMPGTVAKATYVGRAMEYVVETEAGPVFILSPETAEPYEEGGRVGVRIPAAGPVLLPYA